MNVWENWPNERKFNPELQEYEHEDLDKKLQMFYAEVLTKDGLKSSSETQGQLVGPGKNLNGREKKFGRTKVNLLRLLDFSSPEFFSRPFRLFPGPTNCPKLAALDRHLKEHDYKYSIIRDREFYQPKLELEGKVKHLHPARKREDTEGGECTGKRR